MKKLLIGIFGCITMSFAQTGQVVDELGTPVPGVLLSLENQTEIVTSNAQGNFSFESTSSILNTAFHEEILQGNLLSLILSNTESIQISWFNQLGQTLLEETHQASQGKFTLDLNRNLPLGSYFIKIHVGTQEFQFQGIHTHDKQSIHRISSKLVTAIDVLHLSKEKYQSRTKTITDYNEDLGKIQLTMKSVERALLTGDASLIGSEGVISAALLTEIQSQEDTLLQVRNRIFNLTRQGTKKTDGSSLDSIDWFPSVWSTIWSDDEGTSLGKTIDILRTNNVNDTTRTIYNAKLAFAGIEPGRFMVMGGNPFYTISKAGEINSDMIGVVNNTLEWLLDQSPISKDFTVAIANLDNNPKTATADWLTTKFGTQVSVLTDCNGSNFKSCAAQSPDLYIIDNRKLSLTDIELEEYAEELKVVVAKGAPILYINSDGGNTSVADAINPQFGAKYMWHNYFKHLKLTGFDPTTPNIYPASKISSVKKLISHLNNKDYNFDWSMCVDGNCDAVIGLEEEFIAGADALSDIFAELDYQNVNVFETPDGNSLAKLTALLGDKIRESIQFPMDKDSTNDNKFLSSLFADYVHYQSRTINPVQNDLGIFSRTDFSHVTPTFKTVTLTSKKSYRTAGVYAIPGKTVRVIRKDNQSTSTKIRVNTIRNGSTKIWETNKYIRPKFLWGNKIDLAPGDTIQFTSAYGGPIHIEFGTNDQEVEFEFQNIGLHPVWRSSADDAAFTAAMNAGDYDWAEIVTSGFEVHSTLEKMRTSIADTKWGSASKIAAATKLYLSNFPHVLAGFKGPGIDSVPEIHQFASDHSMEVQFVDIVKHMNADQASCGYGCSGNPYDAFWAFNPIGHGDIHELGHGLEKGVFRFDDWEGHSTTNYYSYYSQSHYLDATSGTSECQNLPFETQYTWLQDAQNQVDPFVAMQNQDMSGWSQGAAMVIQMMMLAQDQGTWSNGWHLLAGLHILERSYGIADNNEADWDLQKANLGFDSYTFAEEATLTKNDWFAIALSWTMKRDLREYLNMWGIELSQKAQDQIASYGFAAAPKVFFASSNKGYCESLVQTKLPVDGTTIWP